MEIPHDDPVLGITVTAHADLETVVVTKHAHWASVGRLAEIVEDATSGCHGTCKFLVLDLAGTPVRTSRTAYHQEESRELVEAVSRVICKAPVMTVGWVRREIEGDDLALALACGMLVCESGAVLRFDPGMVECQRTYSTLAHSIGFVRTERLLDSSATLSAEEAYDMLLTHSTEPALPGQLGIRNFVAARHRRHNSACGILRAQRIMLDGNFQ